MNHSQKGWFFYYYSLTKKNSLINDYQIFDSYLSYNIYLYINNH